MLKLDQYVQFIEAVVRVMLSVNHQVVLDQNQQDHLNQID